MGTNQSPMNENRDTESGQFAEKYDTETFLDALRAGGGAASTADVADHVGCPRRTAYSRLDALHDDGRIGKRAVGAGVLWELNGDRDE